MNRDDVIRMAREAGLDPDLWNYTDAFERFFQSAYAAGAAAEREEILAYAKSEAFNRLHGERSPYAYELVNYICAREQT